MAARNRRSAEFGEYLKELREAADRPLRAVAPQVGLSFPHLGRIERGEVGSPPSDTVLTRLAAVYGAPVEEMLERAGVQHEAVRPKRLPSGEEQFKQLMLSPEFKPHGIKEEHLAFVGPALRRLIMDLAANVERHTVQRLEWERAQAEGDEPADPPTSTRSYAEIVGAGTVKRIVDPDWKETT